MTHETGQQRYRRLKRDPLRHQVLAPSYTVPPVRCATCDHSEIMHSRYVTGGDVASGRCLSYGCGCTEYREVEK